MLTREKVQTVALAMPAATHIVLWDHVDVYKVGGKVFVTCGLGEPKGEAATMSFKVSPIGFEVLTDGGPGRQAPYFAKGHWANVALADFSVDDARDWIGGSYALVVAKLTRAKRKELGL